jgi:hypothetical protein
MAGKIFINYRRDDSIGTAGRLHDRLAQAFGRDNLFMDVDHIPAGVDFVDHLHSQVAACDVFIAVIGPSWLSAKDQRGRRRLDKPDDFVTVEIAAALSRNIRVIPVMIEGARMPSADKLPDSIKPLVRRNAVEVRHAHFGRDAEALVAKVREALKSEPTGPRSWRMWAPAGAAALLLVLGIGLYWMPIPTWMIWSVQSDTRDADNAKAQAEADAKRQAEQAEQQRVAALKADEERKAKAERAAAEQRQAEQAEQQRVAALKADEERRTKAEAEAERHHDPTQALQDRMKAQAETAARLSPEEKGVLAAELLPADPQKRLGVEISDIDDNVRTRYKIKDGVTGVVITAVAANSAAAGKGLLEGEVILQVAQVTVANTIEVLIMLSLLRTDSHKTVLLMVADANGQTRFVTVQLVASRP